MLKIKKLILTTVIVFVIIGLGLFVYGLFDALYRCDIIHGSIMYQENCSHEI